MTSCPYKGLVPFEESDEEYFVGRTNEIGTLVTALYGSSLTILFGESGVGKTSVLRAGLLPELRKDQHRVATVLFRDWQKPDFEACLRKATLDAVLLSINRLRTNASSEKLGWDEFCAKFYERFKVGSLVELYRVPLDIFVHTCAAAFHGRLFFIFDQFEEYIYYHPLSGDGKDFDSAFARTVNDPDVSASFLLSLREDGLGKLIRLRGRIPGLLGNIIKLDHLDASGAEEAIREPLQKYNKANDAKGEIEPKLVEILVAEADVTKLEMDESDEGASGTKKRDSGARYRALALQAVLIRLWEKVVGPADAPVSSLPKHFTLTFNALSELAKGRAAKEPEVNYVVRTYFDERLRKLSPGEAETAADIFRYLVRPGGHKRARTLDTLVENVKAFAGRKNWREEELKALIVKLASKPINLLKKVNETHQYELNHDVMAFAITDWSNRQRQLLRERRQRHFWMGAIAASAVLSAMLGAGVIYIAGQNRIHRRQKTMTGVRLVQKDVNRALQNRSPDAAILAAIDSVALCFKEGVNPPPEVVADLRLAANSIAGRLTSEVAGSVPDFIPALVSPGGEFTATVDSGDRLVLWHNWTFNSVGMAPIKNGITTIGFSPDGKRVGVISTQKELSVWDLPPKEGATPSRSNKSLHDELQIPPAKEMADKYWKANKILWKDYGKVCNDWFLDAIGMITRTYKVTNNGDERMGFPSLRAETEDRIFTGRANAARELAKTDAEGATKLLSQLLHDFHLGNADSGAILAEMYVNNARLAFRASAFREAAEFYKRAQLLNPKLSLQNKSEALERIQEGYNYAMKKKFKEAEKSYTSAIQLDPTLLSAAPGIDKSAAELEEESKKNDVEEMKKKLKAANDEAIAGHREEALRLYNDAIEIAPDILKDLVPEEEYNKFAPKGPGLENAPPPANPPNTPPQGG